MSDEKTAPTAPELTVRSIIVGLVVAVIIGSAYPYCVGDDSDLVHMVIPPRRRFGESFFIHPFALPPANGSAGIEMLHLMRNGGLTYAVAGSHFIEGVFLLAPRTRFLAALLQLPMTIGIVSFHAFNMASGHSGRARDAIAESCGTRRAGASARSGLRIIVQGLAGMTPDSGNQ
jgi:hypothetical protein